VVQKGQTMGARHNSLRGGQWRGGGSPVGRRRHKAEERERGHGVLGRALAREDEMGKKKGGVAAMGCPL
jgi:hypothetical protein